MAKLEDISPKQQLELIWSYIKGFHAVHLISIGSKLNLFEMIASSKEAISARGLAERAGLHPPYVEIWCKTACAYDLIEISEKGFMRLAPHMAALLSDNTNPRYIADYAVAAAGFFTDDLRKYPEYFKSGNQFSFQNHGPEFSAQIGTMIAGFHKLIAYKLLPSVQDVPERLENGGRVLDIGCGTGGLLIQLALANPNCTCVGVDVDRHGVAQAVSNVEAQGLSERISILHVSDPEAGYGKEIFDVATMCEVLHELPLQDRDTVVSHVYKALRPKAPLFILDETYPSTYRDLQLPEFNLAVQTAFNELIWGNVVPTAEEQEGLLRSAGFESIERAQIATYLTALTAWKS